MAWIGAFASPAGEARGHRSLRWQKVRKPRFVRGCSERARRLFVAPGFVFSTRRETLLTLPEQTFIISFHPRHPSRSDALFRRRRGISEGSLRRRLCPVLSRQRRLARVICRAVFSRTDHRTLPLLWATVTTGTAPYGTALALFTLTAVLNFTGRQRRGLHEASRGARLAAGRAVRPENQHCYMGSRLGLHCLQDPLTPSPAARRDGSSVGARAFRPRLVSV